MDRPFETVLQAVAAEIERHGGRILSEPCRPEEITELGSPPDAPDLGPPSTCGCGNQTRADLRYLDEKERPQFATICVVCDAGYMMPKTLVTA